MTAAERSAKIEEALKTLEGVRDMLYAQSRDGASPWLVSELCGRIVGVIAALAVVPSPPTLAERIAAPGFDAEVDRARALLDAKDAGWNEGVLASRRLVLNLGECAAAYCSPVELGASIRSLLIPTVPPSEETNHG